MLYIDDLQDSYLDGRPDLFISDFIEAVKFTLDHWLKIHTVAEYWAREWVADGDLDYMLNHLEDYGEIKNGYFSFDARTHILSAYAENNAHNFVKCSVCGSMWENGYFDCDCDTDSEESDDPVTSEELSDWLDDVYYEGLPNDVSTRDLWQALVTAGFDAYRENLIHYTSGIEGEIERSLEAIETAENTNDPHELLAAVLMATQIYHVNGGIMEDYGSHANLDDCDIDTIRNNGYIEFFGVNEYNSFIVSFSEVAL